MVCPELAYLNCYQVLRTYDAPRAQQLLQTVYERMKERANTIPTEALRQSYWENVPWNAEIAALWKASQISEVSKTLEI